MKGDEKARREVRREHRIEPISLELSTGSEKFKAKQISLCCVVFVFLETICASIQAVQCPAQTLGLPGLQSQQAGPCLTKFSRRGDELSKWFFGLFKVK